MTVGDQSAKILTIPFEARNRLRPPADTPIKHFEHSVFWLGYRPILSVRPDGSHRTVAKPHSAMGVDLGDDGGPKGESYS